MFLTTNQPCLVATGGRSRRRRQSDTFSCQDRRTGPSKTTLAPNWISPSCRVFANPRGIQVVFFFSFGLLIIYYSTGIFALVQCLFLCKLSSFLRKQVVIYSNTITSIHVNPSNTKSLGNNGEFKCVCRTQKTFHCMLFEEKQYFNVPENRFSRHFLTVWFSYSYLCFTCAVSTCRPSPGLCILRQLASPCPPGPH